MHISLAPKRNIASPFAICNTNLEKVTGQLDVKPDL